MLPIILYACSFLAIMAGTRTYCGKRTGQSFVHGIYMSMHVHVHGGIVDQSMKYDNLPSVASSPLDASCGVSSTSGQIAQHQTVHNFSCTDPCSYWVLYILDSSMPLGGRCSSLPCTLDTTSILKDAIAVYNSLSLVSRNWMTISTNGTLSMVAQCAYLASYKDPLVVRQGVMLRSTSTSQPVDCSTPQPSTVPRPSVTAWSPLLVTNSVNLTDETSSQTSEATTTLFISPTP